MIVDFTIIAFKFYFLVGLLVSILFTISIQNSISKPKKLAFFAFGVLLWPQVLWSFGKALHEEIKVGKDRADK